MDAFVGGVILGVIIGAGIMAAFFVPSTEGPKIKPVVILGRGRISKGVITCRDCGTPMDERYPGSIGARRFWVCPACGYLDSYIDHDLVKEYQQAQQP